jgi:hypothetical protein
LQPDQHQSAEIVSKLDKDLAALDKEFDEIDVPSLKQYRKLKRVMASITGFYLNGTKKKFANYETMVENLKVLETDITAVRAQLAALGERSEFTGHPKVAQYKEFLDGELQTFLKKQESMEKKKKVRNMSFVEKENEFIVFSCLTGVPRIARLEWGDKRGVSMA